MAIHRINNMRLLYSVLLLCNLVTLALSQTVTVNAGASSIPQSYPNAYTWPLQNQTWINQHNETWHNSSLPNSLWSNATDANGNFEAAYSPGRAPAIPLAVRSPYTSAWASTANNGSLNSQEPIFWDGSDLGWEGIVTVDGVSYEWMGIAAMQLPQTPNFVPAVPISTTYDSSYSNFTFAAGAIQLTASFFSPVTPGDECRTSIPLSYLTVNVQVMDGGNHNVSLYTDVDGYWVTQPPAPLTWDIYESSQPVNATNYTQSSTSLLTWIVQLQNQFEFGEQNGQGDPYTGQGVFPFWGNFTWTTSQGPAQSLSFGSGYSINQRWQYVNGEGLQNVVDMNYRAANQQSPVYGFEHDLGEVGPGGIGNITFTIGNVQTPLIRFLSTVGIESLQPWWTECYGSDLFNLITIHWNDLTNAQSLAAQFEAKLQNDINGYYNLNAANGSAGQFGSNAPPPYWFNGTSGMEVDGTDQFGQQFIFDSGNAYGYLEPPNGCDDDGIAIPNVDEARSYYAFTALAARQVMGACVLTVPSVTADDNSKPYAFMKEISSSGNVNTVDVIFPSMPFWLWAWPEFLEMLLTPLFYNQEHNFYPNQYSMHDLGSRFPNATGHVEGNDEYMPVEESGNMIIMSYAVAKITGSADFISQHYPILQQWSTYVIDYSLIPAVQLSTDDFAGQLANQTNLAIKGIVALDAMGQISSLVGNSTAAQNYTDTAQSYYDQWTQFAIDPSGRHTMLAYQWRSSWGLLYNTYPAKLLNLSVIPDSLWEMQSAWYPTVSQLWGVPLDNRHYWTKSDWEMWTAATCQDSTRRLFVDSLAYWLNTTSSAKPMSDLFQTVHTGEEPTTGDNDIQFNARPVVGGLYSLLALVAAGTAGG